MVNKAPAINLAPEIAKKAKLSLDRMLVGKYTLTEES